MKFDKRLMPRRLPLVLPLKGRALHLTLAGLAALVILGGLVWLGFWIFSGPETPAPDQVAVQQTGLSRDELAFLIHPAALIQEPSGRFKMMAGAGREFEFFTTIEPGLQSFVEGRLATAQAPIAAAVLLEPETGRILALAWHNETDDDFNPALEARFPAASVFKMVTAAAAVEQGGIKPDSKLPYNGRPHTIYRGQLKDKKTKWTRTPTLREAFAKSINPVFGKLAIGPIGPGRLSDQAHKLGFNSTIEFELPLEQSRIEIPAESGYDLALVGAGFSRTNTLNPIHGALLAASVLTGGRVAKPTVIDRVLLNRAGETAELVYQGKGGLGREIMKPGTAAALKKLMQATIAKGTARKAFRRARRDRVLKHLDIGGKTGSINDDSQTHRVDWFVGFVRGKKKSPVAGKSLALAVLVAHDLELRGIRASNLAQRMIRFHFKNLIRTAKAEAAKKKAEAAKKKAEAKKASEG